MTRSSPGAERGAVAKTRILVAETALAARVQELEAAAAEISELKLQLVM